MKKLILVMITFLFITCNVNALEKTIDNGYYSIDTFLDETIALDVKDGSTADGTNIQLYRKNNTKAQIWYFQYDNNGYYSIKSRLNSNKCLDVKGGKFINNNTIQLYHCNNSDAQKFVVYKLSDGNYSILAKNNNLAFDIKDGNVSNNNLIQLYTINDSDAQKFKINEINYLNPKKTINNGYYSIDTFLDETTTLDVKDGSTADGTSIQLYKKNNTKAQTWYFQYNSDGYYSIKSKLNSNKCLDIKGGKFIKHNTIQLYHCNNSDAQKFAVYELSDGNYSILAKDNNLAFNIKDSKIFNSNIIQLDTINNTDAQKFKINEISYLNPKKTIDNGYYSIDTFLDETTTLDVKDGSTADGAGIQLYKKNNTKSQIWYFQYNNDGYYSIKSKLNSNKCLDIKGGKFIKHNTIQLYRCNNSDAQKFAVYKLSDGNYNILSKDGDLAINIKDGKIFNSNKIELNSTNNSDAQKFKINEIEKVDNGIYVIESSIISNKVLDVINANADENSIVQLYSRNNTKAQIWYVNKEADSNYYTIRSGIFSKYYLGIESNYEGSKLKLTTNKFLWEFEFVNNHNYLIKLKDSDLYLNVDNQNIYLSKYKNTDNQKFLFNPYTLDNKITINFDGPLEIETKLNSNLVLDVDGGLKQDRTNIQLYQKNNTKAQIWYANYSNGNYIITSSMNNRIAIDLNNGLVYDNNNVQIYHKNNSDAQKWELIDDGNGYFSIKSIKGNFCLDVTNGIAKNKSNIQVYHCNNSDAQKFKFNKNTTRKIYNGIDISAWQKDIDWSKVANSSVDFAIIRVGIGDNWTSQDDKYFIKNVTGCEQYNIPYGIYLYSYAINVDGNTSLNYDSKSATSEAAHVLRLMNEIKNKGYSPNLSTPIYIDMEDKSTAYLGKEKLTNIALKFCNTINSNGYKCGIYANENWLKNNLDAKSLAQNNSIWLAKWPYSYAPSYKDASNMNPNYTLTDYKIWQFSNNGSINGINGRVDMDLGYDIFD